MTENDVPVPDQARKSSIGCGSAEKFRVSASFVSVEVMRPFISHLKMTTRND